MIGGLASGFNPWVLGPSAHYAAMSQVENGGFVSDH
jgi:hypothetical protein